ncbi:MAG: DUF1993 domain-containing protein [Pseudomonas sp.]|uniref:DUF1993 domain-containing protein n=1 Tax=Pseudomonas sp. TaxID=306 RepID=UPI003393A89D
MTHSMYLSSIPVFMRMFDNLSAILGKALAHAQAQQFDPAQLLEVRLAADMYPLPRQIQIATDSAKGCAARLAGLEVPSYADTETTLAELQARIAKTQAFLRGITPEQLDGSAEREIRLKVGGQELQFSGADYLNGFVLPNFYFHLTTAYNLLRHQGVPLGKMDYLGGV